MSTDKKTYFGTDIAITNIDSKNYKNLTVEIPRNENINNLAKDITEKPNNNCNCKTRLKLTEEETMIIEKLRLLNDDKALRHLPQVIIKNLNIYLDKKRRYNATGDFFDNNFENGDAEMFVNANQNHKRIHSIIRNGNSHLECEIDFNKFEDDQILEDRSNWSLGWQCCRIERREQKLK